MPWFVYILFCDNRKYYVGMTDNIERRLAQHRAGQSFYTKQFEDINLVYFECHTKKGDAEKRELQLKGWSIAKKKALIGGNIKELKKLSKGPERAEV